MLGCDFKASLKVYSTELKGSTLQCLPGMRWAQKLLVYKKKCYSSNSNLDS